MSENPDDFIPRHYQTELMKRGLDENTIIFLPTGSGKTYIALMILKRMSSDLVKSYSNGGKLSIILVNTVALVEQHAKYVTNHTNLKVGQYTGDMNLDIWPKSQWYREYEKHQVLIMTIQILQNIVLSSYIDLNKVNLLIFDECHRGVNDHAMRCLMKTFNTLSNPPRVIGLTATLLNGNCKPTRILQEIKNLEVTFHSKVATVDGLSEVIGFATNPKEQIIICQEHILGSIEDVVRGHLTDINKAINCLAEEGPGFLEIELNGLKPLEKQSSYSIKLKNLINDCIYHMSVLGIYGCLKTLTAYSIQVERLKKTSTQLNNLIILNYIQTKLAHSQLLLKNHMSDFSESAQIFRYSSDKMLRLFGILKQYRENSKEDLCGIIFTDRRFTAKIVFLILDCLSKLSPDHAFINANYIVGFSSNPFNNTRENLYTSKKNRQVLRSFINREVNLLVASNVLEEGVDIPKCTLVIKYDKPNDYRSYIQSKGRARHKDSLYYMIIDAEDERKYAQRYSEFQEVERKLNDYLVGNTADRPLPSQHDIDRMYKEDEIPPYFVGSAQVNMRNAIPLLTQYCQSLKSDIYTIYAPEWYVHDMILDGERVFSVVIILPIICVIREPIIGEYMKNLKLAKRAAALKACEMLHKAGELDDHLLPKVPEVIPDTDVTFLFKYYPSVKEPLAGTNKMRRLHDRVIANWIKGRVTSNNHYYLHIIQLEPQYSAKGDDLNDTTMYNSYVSPLCFGILTPHHLPVLSSFPIYATAGQINVQLELNVDQVDLTKQDLADIKKFEHTVFKDILKITGTYLIFDNSDQAEILLLVPVDKYKLKIDFDTLRRPYEIKPVRELSVEEKRVLEPSQDYLHKIVTPWYRRETTNYIVTEVSLNKNAYSPFPNEEYGTFMEYFMYKHALIISKPDLPLLMVKGLTKRLNFIKPKGKESRRRRDKVFEELTEHLLPELVVHHDFPSSLFVQANFIPTVLYRVSFMLVLEQLRRKIAEEAGLGTPVVDRQPPLTLDRFLLSYEPNAEEESPDVEEEDEEEEDDEELPNEGEAPMEVDEMPTSTTDLNLTVPASGLQINKDFAAKLLESEYPWKDHEEPKDIERTLDVNQMDIQHYENFVNKPVISTSDYLLKNDSPVKQVYKHLPLTYYENFVHEPIGLLEEKPLTDGPSMRDLYQALSAAKANDIVNLERLEILGDSFLKFISSIYLSLRFTNYNEGHLTAVKSRMVSNKNLYYLAERKRLGGIVSFNQLSPKNEWLPPTFTVPTEMLDRIEKKEISINAMINLNISAEEQITGDIDESTADMIRDMDYPVNDTEESSYRGLACFLRKQYIGDKHVADGAESLLGAYFKSCGLVGGIKFVEWLGLIEKSEDLIGLLNRPTPNPILNNTGFLENIMTHIPFAGDIEQALGYTFNNRGYLLQALTHASYTCHRITLSYEKLEFLGDAILDFLITCYIYESCGNLNPGEVTDLRSALVNNNTFASLAVRCNFHKHLLIMNSMLQSNIDKFVEFISSKEYQVNDDVLILLSEEEHVLAEYIDVPKVLGDIFEALAGAVYLDSGKDLRVVWKVFYKIMWKEVKAFAANVPKNIVRRLFEMKGIEPRFGKAQRTGNGKRLIPLQFLHNGNYKVVHGCGNNTAMAKKAAAKLALRTLEV